MKYRYFSIEKQNDLRQLVQRAAKMYGEKIAFKEFDAKRQIREYTYQQLEDDRLALGTRLLDMGMGGYHIALLSESLYAWVVSYLTVVNGVGVVVPMDKELPGADIAKLLQKSDADAVICSETYAPVMEDILKWCPNIKQCIVMNPAKARTGFHDMNELIAHGRKLVREGDRSYQNQSIDPDAMCEILFTSGTTGANKGVMLCQRNITADIYGMMSLIKTTPVSISVLPINHSYECTCHVLGGIYAGITLCFNDSLKHLMDNLMTFKPGMSLMVPLFLETMYKRIWKQAEKEGLDKHLRYGITVSNLLRKIGIDQRRFFFKPVLDKFGGELRQIVCGGAPLRTELIKGFDDIGINVVNGYGITECAPVIATNCTAWKRLDTVGHILPNIEVRIADPDEKGNGEVEVKGDMVMMGYYKDDESTSAVFTEDGYFKTGDLGRLDKNNFLYLTGRKKNLIILPNGKNVSPEELEELVMAQIPYVKEVLVYSHSDNGSKEEYITADVFLDPEYAAEDGETDLHALLEQDMRRLNSKLPGYKRIAGVNIRDVEFEKTTTKKIKRHASQNTEASERRIRFA